MNTEPFAYRIAHIIDAGRMLYGAKIGAVKAATDAIKFYACADRENTTTAVY